MTRTSLAQATALLLVAALSSCGGDSSHSNRAPIVFGPEGNRLHAYATDDSAIQTVIQNANEDPATGRDINGQICFFRGKGGRRFFISGEDTGQPDPPPGWGIFELLGHEVGDLSAHQIIRLSATFQPPQSAADPYGCGVLSDGRIVTTDIGNNASGPPTGQLILWFEPFDVAPVKYCKLDIAIGTAQSIYVDDEDRIYVASARETSGILRYSGPFPTSNDAVSGCGLTDSTGAPLATRVTREVFISDGANAPTPAGVVGTPEGTFYVSSVFNGVIAEYSGIGEFRRRILQPPAGETLGFDPYSTGTPLGIAIDRDGTVYYADLGLVIRNGNIGPGPRTGSFRRILFIDGDPQPPETLQSGLSFPDGAGVLE